MKRFVISAFLLAGLAACTTPQAQYAPAANAKGKGYTDQRVEQDRFRITYRGSAGAPVGQVFDYALLRAAELTLAQGYEWFQITSRNEEVAASNGPYVNLGTGGVDYNRSSSVGVGVSTGFNLGGPGLRTVTLEIRMARGQAPGNPDAYNAMDVARSIRQRIPA